MSKKQRIGKEFSSGLERAPISSALRKPSSERESESVAAFERLASHERIIRCLLEIGTDSQFVATSEALESRRKMQSDAKEVAHFEERTVRELGKLVLGTVSQLEDECRDKTVLDIGCGRGRFGEQIARNAKARVTFLDNNPKTLDGISKRLGHRVIADGRDLPFQDETFEKTFATFSSLSWVDTPHETVMSLTEALRVTEVGGSAFITPAFSNTLTRDARMLLYNRKTTDINGFDFLEGEKIWALQDHVLLTTLKQLMSGGYCSITWSGFVGQGVNTSHRLEVISAIVDKKKTIPPELFASFLSYADSFSEQT